VRFLHTSDWHLGRTLHGVDLLEHQASFLDWLQELAKNEAVDAVLIAGDVYDRAVPSVDAVRLLNDTLARFAGERIPVVLISGNHDSPVRLGFGSKLTEAAGIHLFTSLASLTGPRVFEDAHGAVAIYGVPYLLPDLVMDDLGAERSHASVLSAAMRRLVADARDRGIARTVVLAHAFITGGAASESERDIRVGGVGDAPAGVFAGASYVALGHLHGPQAIDSGGITTVRYSGSPLAYSFSERMQKKSVTLVEMGPSGSVDAQTIPAPEPRPLVEVRGELHELLERAKGDLASLAEAWVKVVLTDSRRPLSPMERLRDVWPHTLMLDFAPKGSEPGDSSKLEGLARAKDPLEVCTLFVEEIGGGVPTPEEQTVLAEAVEAATQSAESR
jgi:DNA repair protein SbcD/Mre11